MKNILDVKNLKIGIKSKFNTELLVKNVSFNLEKGDILGVVGESGSGKTLTCKSIIKLFDNTDLYCEGEVIYQGKNLLQANKNHLNMIRGEEISMIFQNPSTHLDPLMRIGHQISETLTVRQKLNKKDSYIKVIELLKSVNIKNPEEKYHCFPHEFSGGMKQRVMIAAALACNPKILIADEPTTALDVTVQSLFLKLLKEINEKFKISIIFVSHDLGVIANTCNKIVVMKKGNVMDFGTKNEIINHPKNDYTKELISSYPQLEEIHHKYNSKNKKIVFQVKNLNMVWKKFNLFKFFKNKSSDISVGLNDLELNIFKGDRIGVVGESGSGKSTLAKILIKILNPSSGSIIFDGLDLKKLDKKNEMKMRQAVQMIFQDPYSSLNPKKTVEYLLAEPLIFHNIVSEQNVLTKVDELMSKVGLEINLKNKFPHQLSGGQCQRVNIARALSVSPNVLIADEPTSALDVTIQSQIIDLILDLSNQLNLTLIFISHDLSIVRKVCDRIIVMKNGRIVEEGQTEQIFKDPNTEYTRELISSIPTIN